MILIIESCRGRPLLKPFRFTGVWRSGDTPPRPKTWRLGWLWWSVSYYPEPSLRDFMEWVENTSYRSELAAADRFIATHKREVTT